MKREWIKENIWDKIEIAYCPQKCKWIFDIDTRKNKGAIVVRINDEGKLTEQKIEPGTVITLVLEGQKLELERSVYDDIISFSLPWAL